MKQPKNSVIFNSEADLAKFVSQLLRQGVIFISRPYGKGQYIVELTDAITPATATPATA